MLQPVTMGARKKPHIPRKYVHQMQMLTALRARLGLTQEQCRELAEYSLSSWQEWEGGKTKMSRRALKALIRNLEATGGLDLRAEEESLAESLGR